MLMTLAPMVRLLGEVALMEPNLFTAQVGSTFPLDTQQQTEAGTADHQRTTAITEERKGHALGWQKPDVYTIVDQELANPQERHAVCHVSCKKLVGLFSPQTDVHAT